MSKFNILSGSRIKKSRHRNVNTVSDLRRACRAYGEGDVMFRKENGNLHYVLDLAPVTIESGKPVVNLLLLKHGIRPKHAAGLKAKDVLGWSGDDNRKITTSGLKRPMIVTYDRERKQIILE